RQIEALEKNQERLSRGSLVKSTTVDQDGWASTSKPPSGSSEDSLMSRLERLREFHPEKTCRSNGFEFREETEPDLGGEIRNTAAGSFLYFSNQSEGRSEERNESFSSSGEQVLSLARLLIGSEIDFEPFQIAFLDTETTGVSGGSGTYVFLVGVGSWNASGFCVEQFFMRDFHEEMALLLALHERLKDVRLLVTFNGKSFDLPLLDSRYVIARLDRPLARVTHLDLLYPARRLWKLRLGDCSLMNLEKRLLG